MTTKNLIELQQENENLKARLYPFEKAKFLEDQAYKIGRLLYPAKGYFDQPKPQFRDPNWEVEMSAINNFGEDPNDKDGTIDITIKYWSGDCLETHTVYIPQAWMDFDNQIEDLREAAKQWCADQAIEMVEAKRLKDIKNKAAHIKRLEEELKKAKGE